MIKDWSKLFKKYRGDWVALLEDEITVVGHGKTAKEAHANALKAGVLEPILTRMPESLHPYVG